MAREQQDSGSVAVDHESAASPTRSVSPTTHAVWQGGVLAPILKPVACWRIHHAYFRFDSSIVLPEIAAEIGSLKTLIREDRVATIFGHADPVGNETYNAHLSARRARALFGLLTRGVDVWLDLSGPSDYDHWGLASTQIMLATLHAHHGTGKYYVGSVDGAFGPHTDTAIRTFQQDEELNVDGIAGPVTRRRLYERYIDALTGQSGIGLMRPEQFLGDPKDSVKPKGKAKGAFQGCGEHNPVLLLSKSDMQRLAEQGDSVERDAANAPNRRAMVFFFSKTRMSEGSEKIALDWPCPAWDEGTNGCSAQFWPDGLSRVQNGEAERRYEDGERTMACRWYDRMARLSPCEGGSRLKVIKILPLVDHAYHYKLKVRDQIYEGARNVDEPLEHSIPLRARSGDLTVVDDEDKTHYRWALVFEALDSRDSIRGMQQRLSNLGYLDGEASGNMDELTRQALRDFQLDSNLDPTGEYDDLTRAALKDACAESED